MMLSYAERLARMPTGRMEQAALMYIFSTAVACADVVIDDQLSVW